jgi:hypothetical protein
MGDLRERSQEGVSQFGTEVQLTGVSGKLGEWAQMPGRLQLRCRIGVLGHPVHF